MPIRLLALLRKNPVDLMISWSSVGLGGGERRRRRVPREQRRRHHVHALVRALRAQDRGDEELERRAKVQRAVGIGVMRGQPVVDRRRILRSRPAAAARPFHRLRRARAKATTSSALLVLRTSPRSSQPFRAMPIPMSM